MGNEVAPSRPGTAGHRASSAQRVLSARSRTGSNRLIGTTSSIRGSMRNSFRGRSNSVDLMFIEQSNAFDPNSRFIQLWHQVLLGCLLYEVMVLPFLVTFKQKEVHSSPNVPEMWVLYACEVLFVIDIFVELNTGYYEDGNVTRDATKSRKKYLTSARFALDLVVLPPLSLLSLLPITLPFACVFLEFHKLIRSWRIPKYISSLDDVYAKHFVVLKLFKVLVAIVLLSHMLACIRYCFVLESQHEPANEWLPKRIDSNYTDNPVETRYLMSLFWAFGLLTGLFEGEMPHHNGEFVFTIFVSLGGFSLFTYLCATFFMISKCESGHSETAEARINQFKHLLSFHRVPEPLQEQAIEYLKRFYTYTESNDREAIRLLCPSISKDIQVAMLKDMVATIPFFKDCSEQFIIAITSLLEMISLPANFLVFKAGDMGDAMYVVNSGVLHVIVNGVKVRDVRKGSFFGEMAIFLNRPRFATVITTTYCTLYKLVRFHVERVLEGYPQYAAAIPQKVEDMGKLLFSRTSRVSLLSPSPYTPEESDEKPVHRKTISAMLRRHLSKKRLQAQPDEPSSLQSSPSEPLQPIMSERRSTIVKPLPPERLPPPTTPRTLSMADRKGSDRKSGKVQPADLPAREGRRLSVAEQVANVPRRVSNALLEIYHLIARHQEQQRQQQRRWWSPILLKNAIDAESNLRMWWLLALQLNLMYNWMVIPLQLAFSLLDQPSWYVIIFNTIADVVLWLDLYFNCNLSYTENLEKIYDTTRIVQRYLRGAFLFDLACVMPYWVIAPTVHHAALRIPRLLRVWHVQRHFVEVDEHFQLNSKRRLMLFGVLLVMLYHIIACLHFSITYKEGFGDAVNDTWIPSDDINLTQINDTTFVLGTDYYDASDAEIGYIASMQYFRSLYYAANVLTALGRTIEPATNVQYGVALVFMLSGFFITAIVVDNVQKRFTASAFEQKEFFATRSRIQLFLRRQNAPLSIHKRVNAFLDFWWSSHRGAVIGELLEELPESIKREVMHSICKPALQTLALLVGVRPVLAQLQHVFVENVKFILYGQGEIIYRQGDYASGIFFLLEGEVCVIANGGAPRTVPQGGFFGTGSLHLNDNAVSYSERVTAISGCILLFVSREHLQALHRPFGTLSEALLALERRLLDPKIAKASELGSTTRNLGLAGSPGRKGRNFLMRRLFGDLEFCFDPDSIHILTWETWVFLAMTIQWATVMFHICFGVSAHNRTLVDVIMVLLELTFVLDMFIRSHLGYYEFGNKVMDIRVIQRRYFHSLEFMIDLIALLPLYIINWSTTADNRLELLNVNKLFRLFKVPGQFTALQNKYLKVTLELRLFKLVYYAFMVSHLCGCIWFDFASHSSGVRAGSVNETSFGEYKWLPPEKLKNETLNVQYFASLFWSFGLMSASSPGELPKTTSHCIFSVITMTCGFFLFAYVIGNFSDVIELMDAENREFYAKLSSLRHLLAHFRLPPAIEDQMKTYFFFKRFHSITQEYLLERCLPPSLLTDIRMVHLQPMIVKVSFLAGMEGSVTRMLVSQFNQVLIVRDEFVYKFGEEGSDMYFVFTGLLDTLLPLDEFMRESSVFERKTSLSIAFKNRLDDEDDKSPEQLAASPGGLVAVPIPPPLKQMPTINPKSSRPITPGPILSKTPTTIPAPKALTKLNEIAAGSYFGENALFFNSVRTSFVQARTSCILYKLSRNSLEMVFDRYPEWKQKVLRIMKIQQEQQRLNRLAYDEQQNANNSVPMMAQVDHVNARAERTEEEVLYFRRPRSQSKRKHSQSSRLLNTTNSTQMTETSHTAQSKFKMPKLVSALLHGTAAQNGPHLLWLKLIIFTTLYVAILVPYRIAFDSMERAEWLPDLLREIELFCEFVFIWDIWVNWRLKESVESMELYEQDHRQAYRKERIIWDLLAAVPVDYILSSVVESPCLRINRCLKFRNFTFYMHEINRRSISNEMHRLRTTALLYILMIYWAACAYFAIAIYDRFGDKWDGWLPGKELIIDPDENPTAEKLTRRLLRGLFFATTAFVKKGRTFIPDSAFHYGFSIIVCFVGLLIMAFMIGEIASLFISYIGNEVEYRKNHIAVELYLSRWKISGDLKSRTHLFLSSLWSSHRGVDYQLLLEELPKSIRTDTVMNIANWPLAAFIDEVFRPICKAEQAGSIEALTISIAQNLRFEGYPRGESVLVEGSISKCMYFVVKGHLYSMSVANPTAYRGLSFTKGDYFAEKGLLGYSVSTLSVRTLRACDLLSLSSEGLLQVLHSHPIYSLALSFADQAAAIMKAQQPLPSVKQMEDKWGCTVMDVIEQKRVECEAPEAAAVYTNKKARAIIAARFNFRTVEECLHAFRPLIQLIVPNGALANYGCNVTASFSAGVSSKVSSAVIGKTKSAESSRANSIVATADTSVYEPNLANAVRRGSIRRSSTPPPVQQPLLGGTDTEAHEESSKQYDELASRDGNASPIGPTLSQLMATTDESVTSLSRKRSRLVPLSRSS